MAATGSAKICVGAMMMSAVFILQASGLFLPVLGPLFGAACTVCVAAAAAQLKRRAILVYLGAGLLLLAVSPRSAMEFLSTTGFVGLSLGLLTEKNPVISLVVSGLGMLAGLYGMTYLLGTAALGGLFADLPVTATLPVFAVFSAVYPALGLYVLKRFLMQRLCIHQY